MAETASSNATDRKCDCDYWHSKHRFHCATRFPREATTAPAPPAADESGAGA